MYLVKYHNIANYKKNADIGTIVIQTVCIFEAQNTKTGFKKF